MVEPSQSRVQVALAYHERSKHRPGAYARAREFVDWDTQPSPFRVYDGAPNVLLSEVPVAETARLAAERGGIIGPAYDELFLPGAIPPEKLDEESLARFLYDSLALAAWRKDGKSRWSVRVNPSNGNLHPTEAYFVIPPISGVGPRPAVYHYSPLLHALEVRRDLSPDDWEELAIPLPTDTLLVGLTSIVWREAWRFGERAFRFCQHDAGHAAAAIALSAASLGWGTRRVAGLTDDDLAVLVGVHSQRGPEAEQPVLLLAVSPSFAVQTNEPLYPASSVGLSSLTPAFVERARKATWRGTPNVLSAAHHDWPILDVVAHATRRSAVETTIPPPPPSSATLLDNDKTKTFDDELPLALTRTIRGRGKLTFKLARMSRPAYELLRVANDELALSWRKASADIRPALARVAIRGRRSATQMNPRTRVSKETFFRMLARTLPTGGHPVFDALGRAPALHLLLFVHRVRDLAPGTYLLARDASRLAQLRTSFDRPFLWKSVESPQKLPLFLLERGDTRALARSSSCHQAVASDATFVASMLGRFESLLREEGAPTYRSLHWEAGAIGQVLYLEAEAAGLRGTGLGCFLDDFVHEAVGLTGREQQVLYHFAVGGSRDEVRGETIDPYEHRRDMIER